MAKKEFSKESSRIITKKEAARIKRDIEMERRGKITVRRKCLVCGKMARVTLYRDGYYRNAHYFGTFNRPIGKGEHKVTGKYEDFDVVEWTGKEKELEYWECEECYREASHLFWLEERIEEIWGSRSQKNRTEWKMFDEIHKRSDA